MKKLQLSQRAIKSYDCQVGSKTSFHWFDFIDTCQLEHEMLFSLHKTGYLKNITVYQYNNLLSLYNVGRQIGFNLAEYPRIVKMQPVNIVYGDKTVLEARIDIEL
jgi:hypothetical protein